jgi:hypothetical protein
MLTRRPKNLDNVFPWSTLRINEIATLNKYRKLIRVDGVSGRAEIRRFNRNSPSSSKHVQQAVVHCIVRQSSFAPFVL